MGRCVGIARGQRACAFPHVRFDGIFVSNQTGEQRSMRQYMVRLAQAVAIVAQQNAGTKNNCRQRSIAAQTQCSCVNGDPVENPSPSTHLIYAVIGSPADECLPGFFFAVGGYRVDRCLIDLRRSKILRKFDGGARRTSQNHQVISHPYAFRGCSKRTRWLRRIAKPSSTTPMVRCVISMLPLGLARHLLSRDIAAGKRRIFITQKTPHVRENTSGLNGDTHVRNIDVRLRRVQRS